MNSTDRKQLERPRRPYQPPRIEESGGFERLMMHCTTAPGHIGCEEAAEEMGETTSPH